MYRKLQKLQKTPKKLQDTFLKTAKLLRRKNRNFLNIGKIFRKLRMY